MMPRIASEERPLKRQKSCFDYCLKHGEEDSEQFEDVPTAASSPMPEDSPLLDAAPSKTPAVALQPNGLPSTAFHIPITNGTSRRYGVNTFSIQSLQRRFIHQQILQTPADQRQEADSAHRVAQEDDDLDGFVLHSQPTYERVLSQRIPDGTPFSKKGPRGDDDDDDFGLYDFTFDTTACNPAPEPSQEIISSQPTIGIQESYCIDPPADNEKVPPDNGGSLVPVNAALGHTPAVHSVDRVQLNDGGPSGIFPIFRSRKECKIVYIIRHGESEYNRAVAASGSAWEDPAIFDAPLTMKGRQQAINLRSHLKSWNLPEDVGLVTSPLSRAIETLMLAIPSCTKGHPNSSLSSPNENASDNQEYYYRNVFVLPEVSEHLLTCGDIGRNPKDLCQRFPQLRSQISQLSEYWWYSHSDPDKLNCPYRGQFRSSEPKQEFTKRITAFRRWILARPEKVFVAFGHSLFWKHFATACKNGIKQDSLKNCEWMQLHV